jgi:hypothetical protein
VSVVEDVACVLVLHVFHACPIFLHVHFTASMTYGESHSLQMVDDQHLGMYTHMVCIEDSNSVRWRMHSHNEKHGSIQKHLTTWSYMYPQDKHTSAWWQPKATAS